MRSWRGEVAVVVVVRRSAPRHTQTYTVRAKRRTGTKDKGWRRANFGCFNVICGSTRDYILWGLVGGGRGDDVVCRVVVVVSTVFVNGCGGLSHKQQHESN